eukprot:COSAG02_NODE_1374_length_13005_cov_5.606152_9_plen_112_part_00
MDNLGHRAIRRISTPHGLTVFPELQISQARLAWWVAVVVVAVVVVVVVVVVDSPSLQPSQSRWLAGASLSGWAAGGRSEISPFSLLFVALDHCGDTRAGGKAAGRLRSGVQ